MMDTVIELVAIRTCAAVLLALAACFVGRGARNPALVHTLWIVVLLELLVPPLLEVGVVPRWMPIGGPEAALVETALPTADPGGIRSADLAATAPLPTRFRSRDSLPHALGALWTAGAVCVLLLAATRMRRFSRLLGGSADAPAELQTSARRIAARLGLGRSPRVRLVPAAISPMLRPRWGALEILFPSALLERLERGERDALLAHELAHVCRRDHWVRWIELAAGILFWWHPLVWWARRRLRRVEERCCDGLVLETLPEQASQYARGLVKTVEFLAGARRRLPLLASGIGEARDLEERLTMIVKRRKPATLSRPQRWGLAVAAAALLLVLPTWAERQPDAKDAGTGAGLLELEREARELEAALEQARARQRELEAELERRLAELEVRRSEVETSELTAERPREHEEQIRRLEEDVRRRLLEAEAAAQRGDDARAAQLEARSAELEARLEELASRSHAPRQALDQQRAVATADRYREQIQLLEEAGRRREAEQMRRQLIEWRFQMEAARLERERHDELRALGRELEMLRAELARTQAAGVDDAAAELSIQIEVLRRLIENQEQSF